MNLRAYAQDLKLRAQQDRESLLRAKVDPRDISAPRIWRDPTLGKEQQDRAQAASEARSMADGNRARVEAEAQRRKG